MSEKHQTHTTVAGHYTDLVRTLRSLAEAYTYAGKLDDAVAVLGAGLSLTAHADAGAANHGALLASYGQQLAMRSFLTNGTYDEALAAVGQARELAEQAADPHGVATALDQLGFAWYFKTLTSNEGSFETAQGYLREALALWETLGDQRGLSQTTFHLGLIHEQMEQTELAREQHQRSLAIADDHGYALEKSYALRHLGGLHQAEGNLEQARACLAESLALREEIGYRVYLPFSHLSLGSVYQEQQDLATALAHYQAAANEAEDMQLHLAQIFALLDMGGIYEAQQEPDLAMACYQRAQRTAQAASYGRELAIVVSQIERLETSRVA